MLGGAPGERIDTGDRYPTTVREGFRPEPPPASPRLAVRWNRRPELHDAFVSLVCSIICRRRLKKAQQ
ncbi:hypothetical protein ACWFQ6_13090 [Streptomyces althioticus]